MPTKIGISDEDRLKALHNLNVFMDLHVPNPPPEVDKYPLSDRCVTLTLDGGGYHVVWILVLLEKLERQAAQGLDRSRVPCNQIFNFIGGTSAGAITAALLCLPDWNAARALDFWRTQGNLFPFLYPQAATMIPALLANPLTRYAGIELQTAYTKSAPPLLSKRDVRDKLKSIFGDKTLAELTEETKTSLVLLATDTLQGGDPIRFSHVIHETEVDVAGGPYRDVLVRAAVEAAISPPLLTQPLGSYIDAGYGTYVNPVIEVFIEAGARLRSIQSDAQPPDVEDTIQWFNEFLKGSPLRSFFAINQLFTNVQRDMQTGPRETLAEIFLKIKELTEVETETPTAVGDQINDQCDLGLQLLQADLMSIFSFASAAFPIWRVPENFAQNPYLPYDFWNSWFMATVLNQSSRMPNSLFPFIWNLDYRRYQLSLNQEVLSNRLPDRAFAPIPGISSDHLAALTPEDLFYLTSFIKPDYVPFYEALGHAVYEFVQANEPQPFSVGIQDALVAKEPLSQQIPLVKRQMSDPLWVDAQPTEKYWWEYYLPPSEWSYFQFWK